MSISRFLNEDFIFLVDISANLVYDIIKAII